jgi:hypothetical protein
MFIGLKNPSAANGSTYYRQKSMFLLASGSLLLILLTDQFYVSLICFQHFKASADLHIRLFQNPVINAADTSQYVPMADDFFPGEKDRVLWIVHMSRFTAGAI